MIPHFPESVNPLRSTCDAGYTEAVIKAPSPQPLRVRPYRWLAEYYDQIFAGFRFPVDAARTKILGRILPGVRTACDLGCGTGATALTLAREGIAMYAVDLSPGMCRITRAKAKRAGIAMRVLCADMRSFRLPALVDVVTCEFDALNHLPRKSDLRKAVQSVAAALRPGGHFFFDVNNSLGMQRYWSETVWVERPGMIVVMRNGHNRKADRAWSDIEWFLQKGTLWQRHHERVEQVCWTRDEIERTLREEGFDRVRAFDEAPYFRHDPRIVRGCRTAYLARKG